MNESNEDELSEENKRKSDKNDDEKINKMKEFYDNKDDLENFYKNTDFLKEAGEENERRRRKKRKKTKIEKAIKVTKIVLILFIIILVIIGGIYFAAMGYINGKLGKMQIETIDESSLSASANQEMKKFRNIAILGLDSRYDTYDADYRTDCIIIASINTETNDVQLFSIFRDTYVEVNRTDGTTKLDKINHAYYGGVECTLKTINTNLDLNITEYVMADFNAVSDLVDAVGGIDINVDNSELQYINSYIDDVMKVTGKTSEKVTKSGVQNLNGVQAVAYCRIRYTSGKDYKRTERMREVLQKILDKAKGMGLGKIDGILDVILPKIRTNLTTDEIKEMIPKALSFNIKESFGWPYRTRGVEMEGDFFGPAITLETNVKQLHEEVYGQKNYEVPESIKAISDRIIEKTGVTEGMTPSN